MAYDVPNERVATENRLFERIHELEAEVQRLREIIESLTRVIPAVSSEGDFLIRFGNQASVLAYLTESGVPWAIATSGRMESARPTLEALGVAATVPVVTRDQVGHAKPDPDLFLP